MVFHPSYVRTSAVSYTFYFHSFQVSTTSFYSRGLPCGINSFFCHHPSFGCSGAQLSFWQPLISDIITTAFNIPSRRLQLSSPFVLVAVSSAECVLSALLLHLAESRVLRCKFAAGVLFSVTRAQGVLQKCSLACSAIPKMPYIEVPMVRCQLNS